MFEVMLYFVGFCVLACVAYPLGLVVTYPFYWLFDGRQSLWEYMKNS